MITPAWVDVDGAMRLMLYSRELAVVRQTLPPTADGSYWVTLDQDGDTVDNGHAETVAEAMLRAEASVSARDLHVWSPVAMTEAPSEDVLCPRCGVPLLDEDGFSPDDGPVSCGSCGATSMCEVIWLDPIVKATLVDVPPGKTLLEIFKED